MLLSSVYDLVLIILSQLLLGLQIPYFKRYVAKAIIAFYSFLSLLKQTAIDVFLHLSIAVAFKQLQRKI
jgi:hypothetical protein